MRMYRYIWYTQVLIFVLVKQWADNVTWAHNNDDHDDDDDDHKPFLG